MAKKKESEGYCYRCKEYDETLKDRPCKFRDYTDFKNFCLSYSVEEHKKATLRE